MAWFSPVGAEKAGVQPSEYSSFTWLFPLHVGIYLKKSVESVQDRSKSSSKSANFLPKPYISSGLNLYLNLSEGQMIPGRIGLRARRKAVITRKHGSQVAQKTLLLPVLRVLSHFLASQRLENHSSLVRTSPDLCCL